ncbi:hypothetical protein [Turneriella parva]|nr:hypothetical protein [Turneriella parva]
MAASKTGHYLLAEGIVNPGTIDKTNQVIIPPIDLLHDLRTWILRCFQTIGIEADGVQPLNELLIQWMNTRSKLITRRPRKVHESSELKDKKRQLQTDEAEALRLLKLKLKKGHSVQDHLSKRSRDPTYNDPLLHGWGIHHLHFQAQSSEAIDKYKKPITFLLLARIDERDAYLINFVPHDDKYIWVQPELIEILHRHWPYLLRHQALQGVSSTSSSYSLESRRQIKLANCNTTIQIGDSVYGPIGGGIMRSGSNFLHVMEADKVIDTFERLQAYLEQSGYSDIISRIQASDDSPRGSIHLRFVDFDEREQPVLQEMNTGARFHFEL